MILRGGNFVNDERNMLSEDFNVVVALASANTAGGVVSMLNPFGVDVIVTDVFLGVTTATASACTLDIGIAANGSTSADNLIDGIDVNSSAGLFDNRVQNGTNGGVQLWEDDQYLTASKATGSAAGIVGKLYIRGIQSV